MAENTIDFTEIEQFQQEYLPEEGDLQNDAEELINEEIKQRERNGASVVAVKKPQSAYSLFIKEQTPKIKAEIAAKGEKSTAFLSEASKQWNELPAANKQKYIELAQKQKDAYAKWLKDHSKAGAEGDEEDVDNDEEEGN